MTDGYLTAVADDFWADAGGAPPPPRDLLDVVPLTLPVTIVTLPALGFARTGAWLARHGIRAPFPERDRRLHGCLVARAGQGIVFIDGADPMDERRFTLAHEIAHFLIDYQRPRERALRLMGPFITPVLDGMRQPTATESIHAALVDCPFGIHIHLLEREGSLGAMAEAAEDRVDRLAWELLAPAELLFDDAAARDGSSDRERILRERFALPATQAVRYAQSLCRRFEPPPSFVEWLRS